MRTGLIIKTKAGQVVPPDYVKIAHANNPTCFGVAVMQGEKLVVEHVPNSDEDTLNKIFAGLSHQQLSIHMGNYPKGYLPDDIQPFVLVEGEKGPEVLAMLDGDWITKAPDKSNHSDEFFVAVSQLRPMFQQYWRLTKKDVKAVIEEVDSAAGKNALENLFINRGSIHLIFSNGQVRTITKSELEKEYPWGWVSNYYLYDDTPKVAEKPSLLQGLLGGKGITKAEVTPAPKPAPVPVHLPPPPPAPPNPATLPGEVVKTVKYNPAVHGGKANPKKVQGWYKHQAGWCPDNYMEYPEVEVRRTAPLKDMASLAAALKSKPQDTATRILPDVGSTKEEIAERTPPKLVAPTVANKGLPPIVSTERGNLPIASTEPLKQPEPAPAPVETKPEISPAMPPDIQKEVIDKFLPATKDMATDSPTAIEAKYVSFADRVGIGRNDVYHWTVERLNKLLYEYPEAGFHLLCDMRERARVAEETMAKQLVEIANLKARLNMAPTSAVPATGTRIMPKLPVRKTG